jgi:serine/threonine protein kinase
LHHTDQSACPVALVLRDSLHLPLATSTLVAGRYRILNLIHQGPMSMVYRAVDSARGEQAIVLKELVFSELPEAERAEAFTWFLREAHLLSTMRHRALPMLHTSFSEGDRSYLVMEAVPGPSLETRARGEHLSEAQVLRWGIELCEILHFLHAQREPIIYRDLKPANVLERADTGELVLVDFGVARRIAHEDARRTGGLMLPGTAVGTPGYAAPEQYQGLADARSDIYALGATLHRLLTGYDPAVEDPFRHPPVHHLRPDISDTTAGAIDRALSLAPHERFQSATEVREALRVALPATPDLLQSVTAPFYFWTTVLPGMTAPLSLVSFNLLRQQLAALSFPIWSWPALLLGVYLPALLYVSPLYGLHQRGRAVRGPNTREAVRRARTLLLVRLELTFPFWAAVTLASTGGPMLPASGLLILLLVGACVCWGVSIWRAGQAPRVWPRQLTPGA